MKKFIKWFKNYMSETWMYKLVSVCLTGLGVLSIFLENDITILALILCFSIPMFFTKGNLGSHS